MTKPRILVAAAGLAVVTAACSSGGKPASHASEVSDFNAFAAHVRRDLSYCTAGAGAVQIQFGTILKDPSAASQSDLVQLDSLSRSAQTSCDMAKSQDILDLGSLSVPGSLSTFHSLGNAAISAETWATEDTTAVLHDIQKLAESSGNTVGLVSQFNQDAATADHDAATVRYDFSRAAQELGIVNFSGVGLITWTS